MMHPFDVVEETSDYEQLGKEKTRQPAHAGETSTQVADREERLINHKEEEKTIERKRFRHKQNGHRSSGHHSKKKRGGQRF